MFIFINKIIYATRSRKLDSPLQAKASIDLGYSPTVLFHQRYKRMHRLQIEYKLSQFSSCGDRKDLIEFV